VRSPLSRVSALRATPQWDAPEGVEDRRSVPVRSLVDEGVNGSVLRREARYRRTLAAADVIAALLALVLTVDVFGDDSVTPALLLAGLLVVPVAKLVGLYDHDRDVLAKSTLDESPTLFQVSMLYTLVISAGAAFFIDGYVGPGQTAVLLGLLFSLLLVMRAGARGAVTRLLPPERCLIVGDEEAAARVRDKLESSRFVAAEIVGRISFSQAMEQGTPTISDRERMALLIAEHDVHRVILAPKAGIGDYLDDIRLVKSLGVRVSVVPRLFEVIGSSVRFDHVDGLTLVGIPEFGLSRSSRYVKRGFDLVVASALLLFTAPLFAAVAAAIKLDSHGPVFFRQPRIGWRGRRFQMLKFRSMVVDAETRKADLLPLNEAGDGLFKLANDPRVTRVGVLLRRLSLDELPQLINVLRGDMSLVGPRPLVPEDDRYVEGLDRRRLVVPPGMTGIWQVLGSSRVPMREMIKLDYLYAANWSLWTDVKLLIRTVPLVYRSGNR
jgi:exopolysaccharide biosynthesis polyprenyl glycosylphosphotransferase